MAIPRIESFDPSPFTRAQGAILAQGVQQLGQAGTQLTTGLINKSEQKKARSNKIDDILDVHREQFRLTNKMYGEDSVEGIVSGPEMTEMKSEEFKRTGRKFTPEAQEALTKQVPMRDVNSAACKKEEQYLNNVRSQLEGLSGEELEIYKGAIANHMINQTEFQKKYGKDAIQWVTPTVEQLISDEMQWRRDKNHLTIAEKQIQEFETQGVQKFFEQSATKYLNSPQGKKDPSYEGYLSHLISSSGAPDTQRDASGNKLPEDLLVGRFQDKFIASLGDAKTARMVQNVFEGRNQIQQRQLAESKEKRISTQQKDEMSDARNLAFRKTSSVLDNKLASAQKKITTLQKEQSELAKSPALRTGRVRTEEQIKADLTRSEVLIGEIQQEKKILNAITKLGLTDKIDMTPEMSKAVREEVFDFQDAASVDNSLAQKIRDLLGIKPPEQQQPAPTTQDMGVGIQVPGEGRQEFVTRPTEEELAAQSAPQTTQQPTAAPQTEQITLRDGSQRTVFLFPNAEAANAANLPANSIVKLPDGTLLRAR
jgi:hypothetical protein